ncbi:hypothetical protein DL98DRAFT_587765 [Cadophora sp. DSE1049]|nr:hypothetical protein DL98DRAFT_587765 [Cadophora sp. DSE1049]
MHLSNEKFLSERIDSIKAMNLETKEQELDMAMRYWVEGWPERGVRTSGHPMVDNKFHLDYYFDRQYLELWHADETMKDISDILRLIYLHPYCNGLGFSGVHTGTWEVQDMRNYERKIHEEAGLSYGFTAHEPLRFNDEFRAFLKYAVRGVRDPDFRKSGMCGFFPRHLLDDPADAAFNAPWVEKVGKGYKFEFHDRTEIDIVARSYAGSTETGWNKAKSPYRGDIWRCEHIFCRKLKHGQEAGWPPGHQRFPEHEG